MSPLSDRPDSDEDWTATNKVCDTCGAFMWSCPWWDDPIEHGGACIGIWYECGNCGDYDSL